MQVPTEDEMRFLSTPSARRATASMLSNWPGTGISIHALREEGDLGSQEKASETLISIHALREEGDYADHQHPCWRIPISIHALREEGDTSGTMGGTITALFLSTPSARRATNAILEQSGDIQISIHALREEGDALSSRSYRSATKFLSTPSATRSLKF